MVRTLTLQFIQSSPAYKALAQKRQALVTGIAQAACAIIGQITPRLSPTARARLVAQYNQFVETLKTQGWLSAAQATTLGHLANTV